MIYLTPYTTAEITPDATLAERAKRTPTADDHLASAAKALLSAGHMTEADYQRTVNRIREAANG